MTTFRAFPDLLHGTAGPVIEMPRPMNATLAELIDLVPLGEEALRAHLRVKLNGEMIAPHLYRLIRPKDMAYITVYLAVHGGGGDSGKLLSSIAAIALIGASLFVGAFGVPFLGTAFAAGSIGANLVAGGLSIAASLLLQGLNPQTGSSQQQASEQVGVASAQNSFELGGYLQRVAGTRKIAPKMIMPPWTYFEGNDQIVVLAYGLAGPHAISDVRVGYAAVEDDPNIEIEIREGFADDAPLTLITNTVIETQAGVVMTDFQTISSEESSDELDQSQPSFVPTWHHLETKRSPNQAIVNFSFPGGLFNVSPDNPDLDADIAAVTALRMRIRQDGGTIWSNLPEFVLRGRRGQDTLRFAVRFVWCAAGDIPAVNPFSANYRGFSWRYNTVTDMDGVFAADSYFSGSVIDWVDSQHLTVYLDTAVFPQDRYEIEAIRGSTVHSFIWDPATHKLGDGATILDSFYSYRDTGSELVLARGINRYVRDIQIDNVQSVFDEAPFDFATQPTAVLAMRARNRSISQVSCVASGYAPNWDGAAWVPDQITSNPASWYREVLTGDLNAEPAPLSLIEGPSLVDWHGWCASRGLEVNAIFEGEPVTSVLSTIAQAGFARPSYGAPYRVVIDRRRDPVGLITQRNAGGFAFEKPFMRLAHALKVNLADIENDYEVREVIVYADGYNADGSGGLIEATRFESITYPGIVHEDKAIARAKRDLRSAKWRSRLITFTMDIEHLEFTMGDRVWLETDILGQIGGRGRVKEIVYDGGLVSGLRLDEEWNFGSDVGEGGGYILREDGGYLLREDGGRFIRDGDQPARGVILRLADGTLLTAPVTEDDSDRTLVTFETPFAMPTASGDDLLGHGTLVATGWLSRVAREVLAWDIQPGPDLTANITAIDYAADEIYGISGFSSGFSSGFGSGLY